MSPNEFDRMLKKFDDATNAMYAQSGAIVALALTIAQISTGNINKETSFSDIQKTVSENLEAGIAWTKP